MSLFLKYTLLLCHWKVSIFLIWPKWMPEKQHNKTSLPLNKIWKMSPTSLIEHCPRCFRVCSKLKTSMQQLVPTYTRLVFGSIVKQFTGLFTFYSDCFSLVTKSYTITWPVSSPNKRLVLCYAQLLT